MRCSPPTPSNQPQLLRTMKARPPNLRQCRSRERTTWTGTRRAGKPPGRREGQMAERAGANESSPKGERMGMRESISADTGRKKAKNCQKCGPAPLLCTNSQLIHHQIQVRQYESTPTPVDFI